jgi:hypothetical protein
VLRRMTAGFWWSGVPSFSWRGRAALAAIVVVRGSCDTTMQLLLETNTQETNDEKKKDGLKEIGNSTDLTVRQLRARDECRGCEKSTYLPDGQLSYIPKKNLWSGTRKTTATTWPTTQSELVSGSSTCGDAWRCTMQQLLINHVLGNSLTLTSSPAYCVAFSRLGVCSWM